MKPRFLIAAPQYSHQAGGIMALHNLCDMLNRQGFEAAIVFFHSGKAPDFQWASSNNPELYNPAHQHYHLSLDNADGSVSDFLENGIMVYPDLIPGNPLGARRVVRYILCHNIGYQAQQDEYVLSFSRMFIDGAHGYLYQNFVDPNMHARGARHWSERTMDLTYFGKGPSFINCMRIPDTLMLTRTWPEDKNQLGILLRQCRYMFSWDSVSQTNNDAVACGAVPVLIHDRQTTLEALARGEPGAYPPVGLPNLLDRDSVVGEPAAIDAAMAAMGAKVDYYIESWPERVREFALDAGRHFQLL